MGTCIERFERIWTQNTGRHQAFDIDKVIRNEGKRNYMKPRKHLISRHTADIAF